MPTPRNPIPRIAIVMAFAVVVPAMAASAGDAPREVRPVATAPHRDAVNCIGSIQHPLVVHVTALDPVLRGQRVRLRVNLRAERALERGSVRLTSSGGAAVTSMRDVALRAVPAGGQSDTDFSVMVPATGSRVLLQFEVDASGEFGAVRRGASYNLLPDGPFERPRSAVTGNGEKVAEVTARRIDR